MGITLKDFEPANMPIEKQVELLGQYLMENFGAEFGKTHGRGEGAIEMAVRLLGERGIKVLEK